MSDDTLSLVTALKIVTLRIYFLNAYDIKKWSESNTLIAYFTENPNWYHGAG